MNTQKIINNILGKRNKRMRQESETRYQNDIFVIGTLDNIKDLISCWGFYSIKHFEKTGYDIEELYGLLFHLSKGNLQKENIIFNKYKDEGIVVEDAIQLKKDVAFISGSPKYFSPQNVKFYINEFIA